MKLDHEKLLNQKYSLYYDTLGMLIESGTDHKLFMYIFSQFNMRYRFGVENPEWVELVTDITLDNARMKPATYRRSLNRLEELGLIHRPSNQRRYQKKNGIVVKLNIEFVFGMIALMHSKENVIDRLEICEAFDDNDLGALEGWGYRPAKYIYMPVPKVPATKNASDDQNDNGIAGGDQNDNQSSYQNDNGTAPSNQNDHQPSYQNDNVIPKMFVLGDQNDNEIDEITKRWLLSNGFYQLDANLEGFDEKGGRIEPENIEIWLSKRSPDVIKMITSGYQNDHEWLSKRSPYIGIKSIKEDYKKNLIQLEEFEEENRRLKQTIKVLLEKNQNSSLEPVGSSSSQNFKSLEGNVKGNVEEYDETPSASEYERLRQIEREKFFRTEAGRALSRALKDTYPHNTPAERKEVEAELDSLRAEYFSETGYNEKDEEIEIPITETKYYQNQLSEEEIEAIEDENERRNVRDQQNMCDWYEQSKELDFVFGRALTSYGYITCLYLDETDKTEEEELQEFAEKVKEARDTGRYFSESQYEANLDSREHTLCSKVEREFKENEVFDFEYVRTAIMEWAIELDIFKFGDTKYYHPSLMNNISGTIRFDFLKDSKEVYRTHIETGEEYNQRIQVQAKERERKLLEEAENAYKIKVAKFDKLLSRFKLPKVKLKDGRIPVLKVAEMLHMNGYWEGDVFSFNLVEGLLRAWGRKIGSEKSGIYITDRFNHVFDVVSLHKRKVATVARMGNTFESFGKPIPEPSPEWHERERIRVEKDTRENEEGAREMAEERAREEAVERYGREMDIKHGYAKPEDFEKPVPISANLPRNRKEPVSEDVTENATENEPKKLSHREKSRVRRDKHKSNVIEG